MRKGDVVVCNDEKYVVTDVRKGDHGYFVDLLTRSGIRWGTTYIQYGDDKFQVSHSLSPEVFEYLIKKSAR